MKPAHLNRDSSIAHLYTPPLCGTGRPALFCRLPFVGGVVFVCCKLACTDCLLPWWPITDAAAAPQHTPLTPHPATSASYSSLLHTHFLPPSIFVIFSLGGLLSNPPRGCMWWRAARQDSGIHGALSFHVALTGRALLASLLRPTGDPHHSTQGICHQLATCTTYCELFAKKTSRPSGWRQLRVRFGVAAPACLPAPRAKYGQLRHAGGHYKLWVDPSTQ